MSFLSSLFSRKKSPAAPAANAGAPLLMLLHAYVLDCIGELCPEKQAAIQEVVQKVYGGGPDWRTTLRNTLRLGDSLDGSIQGMWERNQVVAKERNIPLTPDDFADMIVQTNFVQFLS